MIFFCAGEAKLYAFSCTLTEKYSKGRGDLVKSSLLELGEGCSRIVNLIKDRLNQQIYVVRLSLIALPYRVFLVPLLLLHVATESSKGI